MGAPLDYFLHDETTSRATEGQRYVSVNRSQRIGPSPPSTSVLNARLPQFRSLPNYSLKGFEEFRSIVSTHLRKFERVTSGKRRRSPL
jgi:hypothetical protein